MSSSWFCKYGRKNCWAYWLDIHVESLSLETAFCVSRGLAAALALSPFSLLAAYCAIHAPPFAIAPFSM